jgi:hypothetical protein
MPVRASATADGRVVLVGLVSPVRAIHSGSIAGGVGTGSGNQPLLAKSLVPGPFPLTWLGPRGALTGSARRVQEGP